MIISEVSAGEYARLFPRQQVVYNSAGFNALNADKVDRVVYAVASAPGGSPVAGLVIGERNGGFLAPFSAPFAAFDFNRDHSAAVMMDVMAAFRRAYPGLVLALPPAPYSPALNSKTLLALLAAGAELQCCNWNYHIGLTADYDSLLTSPARNKLRKARAQGFALQPCGLGRAYEVIRANRAAKGYPLRMSEQQMLATAGPGAPVKGRFFVLTDADGRDAAATMAYDVAPGIAQVIYWGDVPAAPCRHAMNLLAAETCAAFRDLGFHTLDIGPSGDDGVPNFGLSDFKDSIGAVCSPKPIVKF